MGIKWISIFLNCLLFSQCITVDVNELIKNNELILLKSDNFVSIQGQINENVAAKFIKEILQIKKHKIYIYIDSPGGNIMDGNDMIQVMDALSYSNKEIICIADNAASMAFAFLQSCPNRYIMRDSILMQHQMSAGVKGQYENMKTRMQLLESINKRLKQKQADRIGLTIDEFNAKTVSDWWLFGEDAIEQNVADKVVMVTCEPELTYKYYKKTIKGLLGPKEINVNECPLIKS
jgi:ATP-dependent Clp protease protease subunit